MTVEAICVSPVKAAAMAPVTEVEVVAGAGISGDRYFCAERRDPGRAVTLIEAEEIEAFNARNGIRLSLTDLRRNVVTRYVRLNDLVGLEFSIGSARLRGVELCEPCATLAGYVAHDLAKREFIRDFTHRCGLRADVVGSGRIRVGDAVIVGRRGP